MVSPVRPLFGRFVSGSRVVLSEVEILSAIGIPSYLAPCSHYFGLQRCASEMRRNASGPQPCFVQTAAATHGYLKRSKPGTPASALACLAA